MLSFSLRRWCGGGSGMRSVGRGGAGGAGGGGGSPGARRRGRHAYTRGVRRIDRASASARLLEGSVTPRVAAMRHIEQVI